MKLRVRSAQAPPSATFKVEVPGSCSLHELEDAIAESLQSRGTAVRRPLKISLNKREPIEGQDDSCLSQFGICNGDLLFYFESSDVAADLEGGLDGGLTSVDAASIKRRELCAAAAARRVSLMKHPEGEVDLVSTRNATNVVDEPPFTATVVSAPTDMQIDGASLPQAADCDFEDATQDKLSDSIPAILHRILKAEHDNLIRPTDLLIVAVHAVMLETGFVVLSTVEEGRSLPGGWSKDEVVNIRYTLAEMATAGNDIGSVTLKSFTLGGTVIICGNVMGSGLPPCRLSLAKSKHIIGSASLHDELLGVFSDIFELWKCAKDGLSLPLLTALCEITGLPPPSSLLLLPTELKMKILQCLPAMDLVKAGCVCSELRHLCAHDELWEKLFYHDFGNLSATQQALAHRSWKSTYAIRFLDKKRNLERRSRHIYSPFTGFGPRTRVPYIVGGDYDLYPWNGSGFGGVPFRSGSGVGRGPLGRLHGILREGNLRHRW